MKKYTIFILFISIFLGQIGCKKFLDVKPLDKLSGNIFWASKADAESFTSDLYAKLRGKLTSTSFIPATGELRSGYIRATIANNTNAAAEKNIRLVYEQFAVNNLMGGTGVLSTNAAWNGLGFSSITQWYDFYSVIQGANILYDRVDKGIPGLSAAETSQYKAEAAFIRCLTYFLMVRLYGDVPYYILPYQQDPLPRENFVSVLNKCIADLKPKANDLPLAFSDPALRAVRATRGAALDLLMNMNMWNAGFDKANKDKYYQETADRGDELIKSNVYTLMPLENFSEVMKGRSTEGIFEFNQSINYEPTAPNFRAFFGEIMLKYPNKATGGENNSSHGYFRADYLLRLYPTGISDKRRDLWFDNFMLSQDGNFQLLKFKGSLASNVTGPSGIPEWDLIIFRYPDAILLRAEALAELGQDGDAIKMLDMVRTRAITPGYTGAGGQPLKDAIFNERCKELMGEGYLYFDLIRTNRILDPLWTLNPLTQDQFNRGGWTWPINSSALHNNPYMKLNEYWQ
ncbi:MAG TPA: RagB/SusD family nutrient uptake outer membrane protein [Pedobacter sp.]|uniref:RagB/SusD family nutrient uptake outer membrane protein n=1 Tax=Pedobacter sp. TaxID=1411316 RepID=UPI002C17E995|nr:RagB/SusD family nutrient uptake outer membrane protein [Pedobacter sp.]HMI02809.1 RagB/SusD family nutrient uptake outer membrane protein [Pedobacter sp.]